MIKLTNKLYGASLIALAFSLNAINVNAQTCTTAPSCATLGFTKSSSECSGHSILKCPFDQSKVYCDTGTTSTTPTPTPTPTYNVGDEYFINNILAGRVISVDGNALVVASEPRASEQEISDYCGAKLGWFAPNIDYGKKLLNVWPIGSSEQLRIEYSGGTYADYCLSKYGSGSSKNFCGGSYNTLKNSCIITIQNL